MNNMFTGLNQKKSPKNLNECTKADPVSENLWAWAENCENIAKYGAIIFAVLILLGSIIIAISTDAIETIATALVIAPLFSLSFYFTIHTFALLIAALATIVYNTSISANVDILSATVNPHIEQQETIKTTGKKSAKTNSKTNTTTSNVWVCKECGQKNANTRTICLKCGKPLNFNRNTEASNESPTIKNIKSDSENWFCPECCRENSLTTYKCKCGFERN